MLPSNPVDIKRIKDAVLESSNCMTRIEAEKDELKAIAEVMFEELEVPKAVFSKMVKVYHKQLIDKFNTDAEDFAEYYAIVMK